MKILAILVGAETTPACLDAAKLAATALNDPEIEALHVVVDPDKLIAASEEVDFQRLRERDEGTAQQRAEATRAAFDEWQNEAGTTGARITWRAVVGAEEEMVNREAGAADLLVLILSPEHGLDSGDALHTAIFRSEKPVLVVPHNWRSAKRSAFAHVVVGLSDSSTSQHAIEGAGPWLRTATKVTAIRIGEESEKGLGWTRLLSELGTPPELCVIAKEGPDLGAQIVAEARKIDADLLVTGAYRHSEIIEWLAGGTTRHLLAAADMPLLLSH